MKTNIRKNHIVFTTIYYPELLNAYYLNIKKYGHLDNVCVWIVGDKKTPKNVGALCKQITKKGLEANYLDCDWQIKWAKRFKEISVRLPWNNETRRNIGFLQALELGCERLISIDDDNWPTEDDFIGGHLLTGKKWEHEIINEPSGFHNICEHLAFKPKRTVFPRGYPFRLRGLSNKSTKINPNSPVKIGVTAGLWLKEPDVDAITWLNGKVESIGYKGPNCFVLDQSTWSPINTQNTSVIRELIPAYFCIPMGYNVPGGKIQRYGDIWGGYFLHAVLKGTIYHVGFGRPLVSHLRNPHDYVDDLRQEYWGTILTDWLVSELRQKFIPEPNNIGESVTALGHFIKSELMMNMPDWCPNEVRAFVEETADSIIIWAKTCKSVGI